MESGEEPSAQDTATLSGGYCHASRLEAAKCTSAAGNVRLLLQLYTLQQQTHILAAANMNFAPDTLLFQLLATLEQFYDE